MKNEDTKDYLSTHGGTFGVVFSDQSEERFYIVKCDSFDQAYEIYDAPADIPPWTYQIEMVGFDDTGLYQLAISDCIFRREIKEVDRAST